MSSSFFTTPASQRKRKRHDNSSAPASKKRQASTTAPRKASKAPRDDDDESISSGESDGSRAASVESSGENGSEDSGLQETAAERRLRLAERYLDNIRAEVGDDQEIGFDAADVDRDLIAARLKEDVAEEKGRVYRYIAQQLHFSKASHAFFRADTLATLGIAACPPYIYTASKDMRLIKWELASPPSATNSGTSPRRLKPRLLSYTRGNKNRNGDPSYQHHTAPILCVAASSDGKFVATGGADRRLIVWEASTLSPLKVFSQHRDAITGLAFRGKTNQLFSSSKDRTVKIWSLDELAYVETLFGHQDEIVDIAAVGGPQERCISVGARDRTARLWKVVDESQLVFRGGGAGGLRDDRSRNTAVNGDSKTSSSELNLPNFIEGSLDRVAQLDSQLFVTGSDSGALSLFSLHKKKPLHIISLAHGFDPGPSPEQSSAEADLTSFPIRTHPSPRWITALEAIPFSDLFVSGSWDGCVRVWRITSGTEEESDGKGKGQRKIEPVAVLGSDDVVTRRDIEPQENGHSAHDIANRSPIKSSEQSGGKRTVRGVINDLAIFERGERGKGGICVVAAVGTEPRLGRWMKFNGKNGAVVFEVPRASVEKGIPTKDSTLREN